MLEAIDRLPPEERDVFGLVRIQGLTHAEAAEVLDSALSRLCPDLRLPMVGIC
jgi:RNA polymerase sigma-70 factor (ECF subfamily)